MTEFVAACEGQLSTGDMADVYAIAAGHPEQARNRGIRWYLDRDRQIRSALAKARAVKAGVDPAPYQRPSSGFDVLTE